MFDATFIMDPFHCRGDWGSTSNGWGNLILGKDDKRGLCHRINVSISCMCDCVCLVVDIEVSTDLVLSHVLSNVFH